MTTTNAKRDLAGIDTSTLVDAMNAAMSAHWDAFSKLNWQFGRDVVAAAERRLRERGWVGQLVARPDGEFCEVEAGGLVVLAFDVYATAGSRRVVEVR